MWRYSTIDKHVREIARGVMRSNKSDISSFTPDNDYIFWCKHCGGHNTRHGGVTVYNYVWVGPSGYGDTVYIWNEIVCSSCHARIQNKILYLAEKDKRKKLREEMKEYGDAIKAYKTQLKKTKERLKLAQRVGIS